jgi:transcriptional regulator with XRE-family HTH domain
LRLGQELKKLRERAGLTAREAGELICANQARISNIETGRFGVSAERVRTLARNYNCRDEKLIEALVGMTGKQERGWWEEYRGILPAPLLDLAELEHHATEVRAASVLHVPGLLQTGEHARALYGEGVPTPSAEEIEYRASFRLRRQHVLHRPRPLTYRAVIHEAALRMRFGGRQTSLSQLRSLVEISHSATVTVLVIPFTNGVFPGSGQSVNYFVGPVSQLDTAQLDQSHGTVLIDAEAQLDKYRLILDRMEAAALGPEDSRDFINGVIRDMEKESE